MNSTCDEVRLLASPLEDATDLDPLLDRVGHARFALLGEASHGTHEFYAWRSTITRRLVTEKEFAFVAVEGDWPDCYRVSRSVTGEPGAPEDPEAFPVLRALRRGPAGLRPGDPAVSDRLRGPRGRASQRPAACARL